jgi:hypothetical protein
MDTRRMETDSEPERHTCRELAQNIGLRRRFPDDDKKHPAGNLPAGFSLLKKAHLRCQPRDGKGYHLQTVSSTPYHPCFLASEPFYAGCSFR